MSCSLFYRVLLEAEASLPPRVAAHVRSHILSPHLRRCERCLRYSRRLDRLEPFIGAVLLRPSLPDAVRALHEERATPERRPLWQPSLAAGLAGLALAGALIRLQGPHVASHRSGADAARVRPTAELPPGKRALIGPRELVGPVRPFIPGETGERMSAVPTRGTEETRPHRGTAGGVQYSGGKISPLAPLGRPMPDKLYLDGRDLSVMEWWVGRENVRESHRWFKQPLPAMKDDFVAPPFSRVAAANEKGEALKVALAQYEAEARIVDPRLFRKVTLTLKAAPISELCKALEEQLGVQLRASRGVADEKVTVFVQERAARDVMREVARLFGYQWGRTGAEGQYRYEFVQGLRSQLAEEELRSQDLHAAVLALNERLEPLRPYLRQSPAQLSARCEAVRRQAPQSEEAQRLRSLVSDGGYGAAQLYFHLSPTERDALISGSNLWFATDSAEPEHRIPTEWRAPFLAATGLSLFPTGVILPGMPDPNKQAVPMDQVPNAEAEINLQFDRTEAGELSLRINTSVRVVKDGKITAGGASNRTLASVRSPSAARPANATANAATRRLPMMQRVITLQPKPSCPALAEPKNGERERLYTFTPELQQPHVSSADVWEALHRATGMPIVADAYTHLYPLPQMTVTKSPTFDALCRVGDQMGVRWRSDGEFLLARSTSFVWDKLKEVPEGTLRRWQLDSQREKGLPLEDLLEMAGLSEAQVGSRTVGLGIVHCRGLDEWGIVGGGPAVVSGGLHPPTLRQAARALRGLSPQQLKQAQQPEGVALSSLSMRDREALIQALRWQLPEGASTHPATRLQVQYTPCGSYVWRPTVSKERFQAEARNWPLLFGRKRDEVLAGARRYDPDAEADSVQWTRGRLDFTFITADGERRGTAMPMVRVPVE